MNVTNRKIHNVVQGTDEWLSLRTHPASELPMAAGVHKNVKRNEYLRMAATGDSQEFSRWVQENIIDRGHEYEAEARPFADEIIDDELFPVTMCAEIDGMPVSASLDGRTMCGSVIWEHKSWAEELAQAVRDFNDNGTPLPEQYTLQMDEQLTVSGAEKCLFMVSDGTSDNMVWCWYTKSADAEKRIAGIWRQFDEDAANYQHVEQSTPIVGEVVRDLPAVSVQVKGVIAIRDNFAAFEMDLRDFLANKLIRKPSSDQDFADLAEQIKTLKNAEEALNKAETAIISQITEVDKAKRTKDMLYALTRDNRLMAEKLAEARKKEVRTEIVTGGRDALAAHIDTLNERIGFNCIPGCSVDFASTIKGMRSFDNMRDAVATALANAKIAANEQADNIERNLRTIEEQADYQHLFHDKVQLVHKAADDLQAVIKSRIAEHKEAEREKEERIKRQAEEDVRRKLEEEQRNEQIRKEAEEDTKIVAEAEQLGAQQAEKAHSEKLTFGGVGKPKKDIVHSLRVSAMTAPQEFAGLMQQAADEIERLRTITERAA